jgi:DNA replication initiation complex subunit (GINS family)
MKKAILFFAFVFGIVVAADAQCSKSASAETAGAACCSKGKASASATATSAVDTPVQNIGADVEQRTNANGEVSYVRRVVDTESGAVTFKDVEYCTKTNQFIDAGTASVEAKDKAGCADGSSGKAACCASAAGAKGKSGKTKA